MVSELVSFSPCSPLLEKFLYCFFPTEMRFLVPLASDKKRVLCASQELCQGRFCGVPALVTACAWQLAWAAAAPTTADERLSRWPNATFVYLRREGHAGLFNLASIALLAGAGAVLLVVCSWIVAMEVKERRRQARWRPRLPPRPSHLVLLPSPGDMDEGYVEPQDVGCGLPVAPRSLPASDARYTARAHSYLLLLAGDDSRPYEEVMLGAAGRGKEGAYLQPRVIPLLQRTQTDSKRSAGAGKAAEAETGYLPMSGRALPSIIKVLKNGQLALDLGAIYDEYLHMAPLKEQAETLLQGSPRGAPVAEGAGGPARERTPLQDIQLIPDLPATSHLSVKMHHYNVPTPPGTATPHSYETVLPSAPTRKPLSSIQNRTLPAPPLPPPPSTPRPPVRVAV